MRVYVIDLSQEMAITPDIVKKRLEEFIEKAKPNKIHSVITMETAGLIIIIYEP
ncbi:MAG: hypothetical protein QXG35_02665 [Nitrososphaerota archaeon]